MAKLVKTYENGEIKSELYFRGQVFTLTMGQWNGCVRKSKEICLDKQLRNAFPDDNYIDGVASAAEIIPYEVDSETEKCLSILSDYE